MTLILNNSPQYLSTWDLDYTLGNEGSFETLAVPNQNDAATKKKKIVLKPKEQHWKAESEDICIKGLKVD